VTITQPNCMQPADGHRTEFGWNSAENAQRRGEYGV
jgi:hypothetical protein